MSIAFLSVLILFIVAFMISCCLLSIRSYISFTLHPYKSAPEPFLSKRNAFIETVAKTYGFHLCLILFKMVMILTGQIPRPKAKSSGNDVRAPLPSVASNSSVIFERTGKLFLSRVELNHPRAQS